MTQTSKPIPRCGCCGDQGEDLRLNADAICSRCSRGSHTPQCTAEGKALAGKAAKAAAAKPAQAPSPVPTNDPPAAAAPAPAPSVSATGPTGQGGVVQAPVQAPAPATPEVVPSSERPTDEQVTIVKAAAPLEVRSNFGGQEAVMRRTETAAIAVAAQAKAQVEARYVMALQRPRDIDAFREGLMRDSKRRTFAQQAEYAKPIGVKKVRGASIRFVESALRNFRNVLPETSVVFDSPESKIVRCAVTDLEANITYSMDITIDKTVERSQPRTGDDGQPQFISKRQKAGGGWSYLVTATEDDLLNKERSLVSKALRTLGLRILPGDIVEEALDLCRKTLLDEAAKDPDAQRKAIADAFASLNVPIDELKSLLGHPLASCSPQELVDLRQVYTAIRDGEQTWAGAKAAAKPTQVDPPRTVAVAS